MSLRELVDAECGGANPLMRLGNQIVHDVAHKDEGISGLPPQFAGPSNFAGQSIGEAHLVNEFLDQVSAPPPQTFRMDDLLQEMREIDARSQPQVMRAPGIVDEINKGMNWANDYHSNVLAENRHAILAKQEELWQNDHQNSSTISKPFQSSNFMYNDFAMNRTMMPPMQFAGPLAMAEQRNQWTEAFDALDRDEIIDGDWIKDFEEHKVNESAKSEEYNKKFWDRLQDEWKKISTQSEDQPPWLSEFSEYYDPYKEYTFDEDNPMLNDENAFEKGKAFLAQGDIPSAVMCFEAAAQQQPENADVWEELGIAQTENEKDPSAISALKKSLELRPNNRRVLMALAIAYTNESLQNQALQMLINWLRCTDKYESIVPPTFHANNEESATSSLINGIELKDVQDMFLQAVRQSPATIDPEIQEALGVLFNLSSEYDKAADCFRAALTVSPESAKIWNRLGASLANGNQSIEAVDAYQHALSIEPGYIRARYNVGIICINLKAYKEAIEHFLVALNHQATSMSRSGLKGNISNNQMSDTIWSTLRMAVSLMGRTELQQAIDDRDLKTLNEAFKTEE